MEPKPPHLADRKPYRLYEDDDWLRTIKMLLRSLGENECRSGLIETPKRFLKALEFYTSGYGEKPEEVFKVFEDGAEGYDEMITLRGIPLWSSCEHHLAPFFGVAHVGYIPNGKIVGLSKIPRLVDIFARRLQVQERLTSQIADCMQEHLKPIGCGVVIEARHTCMECRGVQKSGIVTTTSALRGVIKDKPDARAEFLSLIYNKT